LPEPPTSVFSTNNLMTLGVLLALKRQDIRIPEQVAVVSFDDCGFAELLQLPLTVVVQQPYEMGRVAVDLLLERISEGSSCSEVRERRIPVSLRIRENVLRVYHD